MTVFESPYPDVEIPAVPLTEYVLAAAPSLGDQPAVIDADTGYTLTFAGLARDVQRVAHALRRRGLAPGEVVGLICFNDPVFPVAFHGVVSAGGVVTPLNPAYTADEIGQQLRDSGATLVFSSAAVTDTVHEAAPDLEVITITGDDTPEWDALLRSGDDAPSGFIEPVPGWTPDSLAALPYSSGTTGLSKAVMLTHRNLVANIAQSVALQVSQRDRVGGVLPFFHIFGLSTVLNLTLRQGATLVSFAHYDGATFLQRLAERRVTRLFAVPPIILGMLNDQRINEFDLNALQNVLSGAAPLSAEIADLCASRIGVAVTQGYGLTEASPATHLTPKDRGDVPSGSIGYLVPNSQARLLDLETGEFVGANHDGELLVSGPQIMAGYLYDSEATARTVDDQGYLHTGDVARVDDDGHWFIVDRVKELIKYKGFQVAPAEIEALLLTHPAVVDAALVGIRDDSVGEIPKAFVAVRADVDPEEIAAYVNALVAPHKKIRAIEIVDVVPRSASGKILRRALRDRPEIAGSPA